MTPTLAAAAIGFVVVVQDPTALRAAARDSAPQQARLWPGDLLELRGRRIDHLQVWDPVRERGGYVHASQVRPITLDEAAAPQWLAVARFLRDTPGSESLAIAYLAAYLKAAPAARIDAEVFDLLGTQAERLARRASSARSGSHVGEHLDVARRYGLRFSPYEREGTLTLCYDGDAFRRVLAMPAAAEMQARAVLALTRHDCVDPALHPQARHERDLERAALLDHLGAAAQAGLPEVLKNRLRLRRAGVWAALAFQHARRGEPTQAAARRAIDELAAVNREELGDDDRVEHTEAAIRVGASRWGAEDVAPVARTLTLRLEAGDPGQTCLVLGAARTAAARRCTWGTVWPSSLRVRADGRLAVLAVQPLESWTELWLLRAGPGGWSVEVLPPVDASPGLGYVEFAGFVPASGRLLVARESRADGRTRRSFEVISTDTLATEKQASRPQLLAAFAKWQDVHWRRRTLSLR